MTSSGSLLSFADRLVRSCPAPALLVTAGGRLRTINRAAAALLGSPNGDEPAVRELLGVGWRELELIARDGDADLVADLPARAGAPRQGARVRTEPLLGDGGELAAVVAFLEPSSGAAPPARGGHRHAGFAALFGEDPELLATKAAAERFARTQLPVLLLAETGTGKELLARAIHGASPRRDHPFVAINCGALSPHLLESELFGYAPGAFTGASRDGHDGKIGAARGGTLFLDEVAEMPGPLQALLLRVLEDGTYYRVGESRPRHADVRLICATCRDLPRLVADGAFRQDLYYRVNGACLTLPPLRRRRDVGPLIRYLLAQLAGELGFPAPPPVAAPTFDALVRHPWPGNVRQLKTALQHALILAEGDAIRGEHLPRDLGDTVADPVASPGETAPTDATASADATALAGTVRAGTVPTGTVPAGEGAASATPRPRTLVELELDSLRRALEASSGNLTQAARELGIARTTLYRRLRKHGFIA